MQKKIELVILLAAIVLLAVFSRNLEQYVSEDKVKVVENTVVIDAGHGGC